VNIARGEAQRNPGIASPLAPRAPEGSAETLLLL
jgi:hypothetical protein